MNSNKQRILAAILDDLYHGDMYDMMSSILNHFQDFNGLEHMCALESQMDGNYNNELQRKWLENFSAIWEMAEDAECGATPTRPISPKKEQRK